MSQRVAWLQHVSFEGLGSIEPWMLARGHVLMRCRPYAGDPLPTLDSFDWLIALGGPMNADDERSHPWLAAEKRLLGAAIAAGKRVLGICLGAQLMARALGSEVAPGEREIGWFDVELTPIGEKSQIFSDFSRNFTAFHWHGDHCALPDGARRIAASAACRNQAFVYAERAVALQYHLETTPASAAALVQHCGDELTAGPWVQTPARIKATPEHFAALNRRMAALLARLEDA